MGRISAGAGKPCKRTTSLLVGTNTVSNSSLIFQTKRNRYKIADIQNRVSLVQQNEIGESGKTTEL